MAALTQASKAGPNWQTGTALTLTSSDTLTFQAGTGQELYLINKTAGALTPTITGSAAVTMASPNGGTVPYGSGSSPGSIPVGGYALVKLDVIPGYLMGTLTITGGTGLTALLMGP